MYCLAATIVRSLYVYTCIQHGVTGNGLARVNLNLIMTRQIDAAAALQACTVFLITCIVRVHNPCMQSLRSCRPEIIPFPCSRPCTLRSAWRTRYKPGSPCRISRRAAVVGYCSRRNTRPVPRGIVREAIMRGSWQVPVAYDSTATAATPAGPMGRRRRVSWVAKSRPSGGPVIQPAAVL